jgi:hypothetical protein
MTPEWHHGGMRSSLCLLTVIGLAGGAGAGCQGSATPADDEPKRDFWGRTERDPKDDPVPPSFDPIVLPRPGARASGEEDESSLSERRAADAADAGWQEKLALVRELIGSGEDDQALTLLNAALAADPPAAIAGRLKELKHDLRLRRVEEGLLRADVRPVRDVVAYGSAVEFKVRLRNVSSVEIVFGPPGAAEAPTSRGPRPGGAASSPTVLTLEVLRRDRDVYASLLERSSTQTVYLQSPRDPVLRLAPGELREFPVTLPAEEVGRAIAGVRVLEVWGTLRPTGLTVGGEPEPLTLRVRKGRVVILPQGFEPLVADPLGSIERALPLGAAAHVLVATEFVPRDRAPQAAALLARALAEGEPVMVTAAQGALGMLRERGVGDPLGPLVEPLLASLETRPERAADLIAGLRVLTDARLAADARLWQDWWRRTKDRAPVVTAPDVGSTASRARAEPAR